MTYSISLLFEGISLAVIVTFMLLLYWEIRYPAINMELNHKKHFISKGTVMINFLNPVKG
jgi:hypothetical protein